MLKTVGARLLFWLVIALVAVAIVWYLKNKTLAGVKVVAESLNPFNSDNIINKGFESLYQTATGSTGSIGTDVFDFLHPTTPATPAGQIGAFKYTAADVEGCKAVLKEGVPLGRACTMILKDQGVLGADGTPVSATIWTRIQEYL